MLKTFNQLSITLKFNTKCLLPCLWYLFVLRVYHHDRSLEFQLLEPFGSKVEKLLAFKNGFVGLSIV